MLFCGHLIILDVGLLRKIFDQEFMLSCDSSGESDIYLGVEPLIPLVVDEALLMKNLKVHLLFINGGKWVLILCLGQYVLINKGHELKCTIACACCVLIDIVLHLVQPCPHALTSYH